MYNTLVLTVALNEFIRPKVGTNWRYEYVRTVWSTQYAITSFEVLLKYNWIQRYAKTSWLEILLLLELMML